MIDPNPRRTAREAMLVERDRHVIRRPRAFSVSDSESGGEEAEHRHLDRNRDHKRRRYDQQSSISVRSSRGSDHDHDIIVESSPLLDFHMPATALGGIGSPTRTALSVGVGALGSDLDIDLDTESESGEAFRRTLEAEVRGIESSYLGLEITAMRTAPLSPLKPSNVVGDSRAKTPNGTPSFPGFKNSNSTHAPGAAVATRENNPSTGTDRPAYSFPPSPIQAVDDTQADLNSLQSVTTTCKRIPVTPLYPPPLSESDLEDPEGEPGPRAIRGDEEVGPSVPFPQNPPVPPPDS